MASVRNRAEQIMMENPGVYSPEMAVEMAEKEVTDSTVKTEQHFSVKLQDAQIRLRELLTNPPPGVSPDGLRRQERVLRQAIADAQRESQAAVSLPPGKKPTPRNPSRSQLPPLSSYGRDEGANLPLPVDSEVQFDGMPPVSEGLDPARVRQVASGFVADGMPADEAWSRAQVMLMRGPGRGGVPAQEPVAAPDDMWSGWEAFEGADVELVKQVATYLVKTKKMAPNAAWQAAQVEASRRGREGTTSTHGELDSRIAGGRASEVQAPDRRVPGPNDPTGVPTSVSREMGPEEQYQYNYRAPSGSGGYDMSNRDMDMAARGMVPIQTPDGVRYMVSAEYHPDQVGRDGVPGLRPDLAEHGYEVVQERDITGANRRVYKYTGAGATRAYNEVPQGFGGFAPGSPRARRARIKAIAESGGMTYAEAEGLVSQAEADAKGKEGGPVPGSHAMYDSARDQAQTNRDRDRLERVKAARQAAMLAGGQPTSGPGGTRAFSAGLGMLPDDWRNQVMANQLSGGSIRGATPNDVTAAQNQQLTELGQRVATGQGFAQGAADFEALRYRERLQQEQRVREGRVIANNARRGASDAGSAELRARRALSEHKNGYSNDEIDAIMNETSGSVPPMQMPPAGATGPSSGGADGGFTG
jgi:hypothetical protein